MEGRRGLRKEEVRKRGGLRMGRKEGVERDGREEVKFNMDAETFKVPESFSTQATYLIIPPTGFENDRQGEFLV